MRLVDAGVNVKVIQETLGHSDVTTLNIYADVTEDLKKGNSRCLKWILNFERSGPDGPVLSLP